MIRYKNKKHMSLEGFETPFQTTLDKDNRWVKMNNSIPWDKLAMGYYRCLSSYKGSPAKDARLVKGLMATIGRSNPYWFKVFLLSFKNWRWKSDISLQDFFECYIVIIKHYLFSTSLDYYKLAR